MVICIDYKEVYKSQGKTPWTRGAQAESCSGPRMKVIKEKSTRSDYTLCCHKPLVLLKQTTGCFNNNSYRPNESLKFKLRFFLYLKKKKKIKQLS